MGWLGWLSKGSDNGATRQLDEWRTAWQQAATAPGGPRAAELRTRLDALNLPEEEIEIEREMLEGLEQVEELSERSRVDGLPAIETGHRVVGHDVCHFTAPASMPDDPAQPSGRLFLTSTRAIFVGGGRSITFAWHAVGEPLHAQRDVLLVRADRQSMHRFRCNSFADALSAAFIARHLVAGVRARRAPTRT